jgi:hypothetical protein
MGTLVEILREAGRRSASPSEQGAGVGQISEREQAIIDRHKQDALPGSIMQGIARARAQREIDTRQQQRAYAEQAPSTLAQITVEPTREMLSSMGDRAKVLDTVRKLSPEQREEALRLTPGIAQQLGDDRGGALQRTWGALSRGVTHGVAQPIAELVGLGGTPEEIEFIRQLDAAAAQEFAPARPGDPWYERGPLQAVEMAPWMATNIGAAGVGRAAATGIAGRVAGSATGARIASGAAQAGQAVGRQMPTLAAAASGVASRLPAVTAGGVGAQAGITAGSFPAVYAGEVDQLKEIGMEDGPALRVLAGATALIASSIEGLKINPFEGGAVSLTEGATKAARQYLWNAIKNAPGELSEEYLQGVTSGVGQHVAGYIDANVEDKSVADAFATGWEQAKEAALPMAFLLGVPAVGGAGLSAARATRVDPFAVDVPPTEAGQIATPDSVDVGTAATLDPFPVDTLPTTQQAPPQGGVAQDPFTADLEAQRLSNLQEVRAKGPVSRRDGRILGEEFDLEKQEDRTAAVDAEIERLTQQLQQPQGAQDAIQVQQDETRDDVVGDAGTGRQEPGSGEIRVDGQGEEGTQPPSQEPTAQEVQVDEAAEPFGKGQQVVTREGHKGEYVGRIKTPEGYRDLVRFETVENGEPAIGDVRYEPGEVSSAPSETAPEQNQQGKPPAPVEPPLQQEDKTQPTDSQVRPGKVGDMLESGQVVTTSTGRQTTPFPKVNVGSDRKATNTIKRVDKWLYENAVAEAKSRGDDFNLRQFESEDPAKMPPATKDSMELYLFGEDVPEVPKRILKDVGQPAAPVPEPKEGGTARRGLNEYEPKPPTAAFHGTRAAGPLRSGKGKSVHSQGIWLTSKEGKAKEFAEGRPADEGEATVRKLNVNIKNPVAISNDEALNTTVDELKADGFDGAYIIDTGFWVAFDAEQVSEEGGTATTAEQRTTAQMQNELQAKTRAIDDVLEALKKELAAKKAKLKRSRKKTKQQELKSLEQQWKNAQAKASDDKQKLFAEHRENVKQASDYEQRQEAQAAQLDELRKKREQQDAEIAEQSEAEARSAIEKAGGYEKLKADLEAELRDLRGRKKRTKESNQWKIDSAINARLRDLQELEKFAPAPQEAPVTPDRLSPAEQARKNLQGRGKRKPTQAELDAETASVMREREADSSVRREIREDMDAQRAQTDRREFVSRMKSLVNPATVDSLGVGDIAQVNQDIERGRVSYEDVVKIADEFVAAGYLPQLKREQIQPAKPLEKRRGRRDQEGAIPRPGEQAGLPGMEDIAAEANAREKRLNEWRKSPVYQRLLAISEPKERDLFDKRFGDPAFADANVGIFEGIRKEIAGRVANSEDLRDWTDVASEARKSLGVLPESVDAGSYDEVISDYIYETLLPELNAEVKEVKNDSGTFKIGDAIIDNETGEDGVIEGFSYNDDGKAIATLESQRGRSQDEVPVEDLREQQFPMDEAFQVDTREEWDAEIKRRLRERMGEVDYDNANIKQAEGLSAIDDAIGYGEDNNRDWYEIDDFRYFEEIAVEAMPEPTAEEATTEVKTKEQQVEEILGEPSAAEVEAYPERPYGETGDELIKRLAGREWHQVTKADFLRWAAGEYIAGGARRDKLVDSKLGTEESRREYHKQTVAIAIKEGKPVPPEVLADYPNLKPGKKVAPADVEAIKALTPTLEKQVDNETSMRRKVMAAVSVIDGETPQVQQALIDHLRTYDPQITDYAQDNLEGLVPLGMQQFFGDTTAIITELERKGRYEQDGVQHKIVPGSDMVGGKGTWDIERTEDGKREVVARGFATLEDAQKAAAQRILNPPEDTKPITGLTHVVEYYDDKSNRISKRFKDLKKAQEYARKHQSSVQTQVPPIQEGKGPKLPKLIKYNKKTGDFDVSKLSHEQASAVDDRLEKEVSPYGDEGSPPKILRKAVQERARETRPERPEPSDLAKELSEAERRFGELGGDARALEQTRQNLVSSKTQKFATQYGVPDNRRSRSAKKWKSEMANARGDAQRDPEVKAYDKQIDEKLAEKKSLEPELLKLRKQVAAERQQAIRDSGNMLEPGTIIISNREGAQIAGRIESWNEERGEYDYSPGMFSPESGTFQPTSYGDRVDNISHAAATQNYSTLDGYQAFEAVQEQAQDAMDAMRKDRSDKASKVKQVENRKSLTESISLESPVKTTVARVLTEPVYGEVGDKEVITDGRFLIMADAAPANLKKRDKDLKAKGKVGSRFSPERKAQGKPILDAASKDLGRQDDEPLTLLAYQKGSEVGYDQAILTDGTNVVVLDADYYNFFSNAGMKFHANRGAFAGDNGVLIKKDGVAVGVVAQLAVGETPSLATIKEVLAEKRGEVTEQESDEGSGIAQMKAVPTRQSRSERSREENEKAGIAAADIQKTAERLFGTAIRQGGFSQRAAGIYKWLTKRNGPPSPDVARTAEDHYANLAVIAHEIAHGIDEKTKAVKGMPTAVREEVKRLDYEPEKGRAFEGWAEFLRRYMTEPPIDVAGSVLPNPALDAPQTLAWFEDTFLPANPKLADSIGQFRQYAQQFAQQSVFQRVGTLIADRQPQDLSFKERWLAKSRRRVHRFKSNFVDKFHTLEWIQEKARKLGHKGLGIYDMTLAYFMSASSHATIAFEEGVRSLQTGAPIGNTPLWSLRDNLESDAEYNDAVLYSLARHTLFMDDTKPGYNTGMDVEDAQAVIDEVESNGKKNRYEEFARKLARFNNDLIEMLVEAGALPRESANAMLQAYDGENYFPLHRVQDTERSMFAGAGVGFVNLGKAVPKRSRKGSGRQIVDPLDATVARAMRFYGRAIQARQQQVLAETLDPLMGGVGGMGGLMDRVDPKRKVTQGTIDEILKTLVDEGVVEAEDARAMRIASKVLNPERGTPGKASIEWFAERHGIEEVDGEYDWNAIEDAAREEPDALAVISLWRPDYTPSARKRTVVIYDKQGNPIMYEMDPDLYATATGMDELQFNPFMSILRESARYFKTGAVGASTGFGTANLLRDYWEFQGKARHTKGLDSLGKPPVMLGRYVAEKAKKLAGQKASDPLIRLYEETGGKVYSVIGHDVNSRKRYRRRRIGKSTMSKLGMSLKRPGESAESVLQGIQDLISISDAPPRLADAEAAIKEDGFEVRDGKWFDTNSQQFVDRLPEITRIKAATAMAEATINFKRIGRYGQYVESFVPFFNATVQATYRQYGQMKGLQSIGKKDVEGMQAKRYLVYLSALASSGVLYWMLRHDDDDWREQDAYLRDGYWTWGINGKTYVRVPKPRDTAIVSNLTENMLDAWYHDDARNTSDVLLRDFGGRVPTGGGFIRGGLETYIANYDYFRERDLVPYNLRQLPKEQQVTSATTRASKAMGDITGRYLNTSPIQLEHLLNSASGGFYRRMADLYDASIDGRLGPEHIPFLRGLLIDRHQARTVNTFYEMLENLDQQAKRDEVDKGKVSDEVIGKLAVMEADAELMTAIRNAEQKRGARRSYEYQSYVAGLARHSLGYEELESNPNPLTAKELPEALQRPVREHKQKIVFHGTEKVKARSEYKNDKAYEDQKKSVLRGEAKLKSLNLSLEEAKQALIDHWEYQDPDAPVQYKKKDGRFVYRGGKKVPVPPPSIYERDSDGRFIYRGPNKVMKESVRLRLKKLEELFAD